MKRRQFLLLLGGAAASACGRREFTVDPIDTGDHPPPDVQPPPRETVENPIPAENRKPGHPDWRSGLRADSRQLEVYLSTDSQAVGGFVSANVSADRSSAITAEVYRLGYYGGAGARRVWSGGPLAVSRQGPPHLNETTGRVECNWDETFRFQIGADWVAGLYLLKVKRSEPEPYKRFAPFVVRDRRRAEILLKAAFNTYQAYNNWGGESLYQDDTGRLGSAREVSYNRPYHEYDGTGNVLYWEHPTAFVLEARGYDVTYATNMDFLRFPDLLDGIGAVLIPGHDEYWTTRERTMLDAAVNSGRTSLIHLSANGSFWRVRAEADRSGSPHRTVVCYKGYVRDDPVPNSTIHFRDNPDENSETRLFGVSYEGWQYLAFPLVVRNPDHWLFRGTGITAGELLPGIVGVEFDRLWADLPTPSDVSLIAESPVISADGDPQMSQMVERTLPAGNTVFSAGAITFSAGLSLSHPLTGDDRVVRMFFNAVERALAHRRAPVEPPAPGPIRPNRPQIGAEWVSSVDSWAGTVGSSGLRDGDGHSAQFFRPSALAATRSGQIVVADAGNHAIRLIEADRLRTVRTIAGTGRPGSVDGVPGAQAMFKKPNGVAVDLDGTIYVADAENHVIRRIENNPPTYSVSTYAGGMQQPGFVDSVNPLAARFNWPVAMALDAAGNLYVAEIQGSHIRMIRARTREVITYAGNGRYASVDAEIGTNASFFAPSALAVGPGGDVYVLDCYPQHLRRISPAGRHRVDTIAGLDWGVGYVDGSGSQARFRAQLGMAVNDAGDILLADSANYRIRKIVPGSTASSTRVSTIAGSGRAGTRLGSGELSDICAPAGLAIAPDRRLLVSDCYNHVIRSIAF